MTAPTPCPVGHAGFVSFFRPRFLLAGLLFVRTALAAEIGLFSGHTDIGAPAHTGTVAFDAAADTYTVGGAGANMWFKADSFHYVWQEVQGDRAITADISFPQAGGNNHRKGVLMFRQSLDADSAYVDVAVHGDGLTSLQFREAKGEVTHEVQSLEKAPPRVRLEKVGDYVYFSLLDEKGGVQPTGCSARVVFKAPFYVGIGVCAHDDKAFETVKFSQVVIGASSAEVTQVRNSVEYVKVPSGDRVCVVASKVPVRDLAWGTDGMLRLGKPAAIVAPAQPTAVSPDGKWTATLERQDGAAILTLRPAAGGDARVLMRLPDQAEAPLQITWSPDSTKIAYIRAVPR